MATAAANNAKPGEMINLEGGLKYVGKLLNG